MRRKAAISCFLLLLFSLVILFPGYGQSSKSKQVPGTISLANILKKCLSTGMNNLVEEERPSEEEDGHTENTISDFIIPDMEMTIRVSSAWIEHTQRDDMHTNYSAEILCPPPNSLSI